MVSIDDVKFETQIFPDQSNKIWLERRQKMDIWRRAADYELIGFTEILKGCNEKQLTERLTLLDLSYFDPLTGIFGEPYFLKAKDFLIKGGMTIAVKSESIEVVNRKLGYAYGNLLLYVTAKFLKGRLKQVIRISSRGRKFLIIDDDWSVINDLRLIFSRVVLRISNGYEIKGIGIEIVEKTASDRTWCDSTNARILTVARITEEIEWCYLYEFGRLVEKIEGPLLEHIFHYGEQSEILRR